MEVVLFTCWMVSGSVSSTCLSTDFFAGLYRSYNYYKTHPNVKPEDPKPHTVLFWFPFDHNLYYKISIAYESFHIFQTLNYNGVAQSVVSSGK